MHLFLFFRSKAERLGNGKFFCTLLVHWGQFEGKGANFKLAKATAAKRAMEELLGERA